MQGGVQQRARALAVRRAVQASMCARQGCNVRARGRGRQGGGGRVRCQRLMQVRVVGNASSAAHSWVGFGVESWGGW